jgi:hypothetical protein
MDLNQQGRLMETPKHRPLGPARIAAFVLVALATLGLALVHFGV